MDIPRALQWARSYAKQSATAASLEDRRVNLLLAVYAILDHLEAQAAGSSSSAPDESGDAKMLSTSWLASPDSMRDHLLLAIVDCSRLTPSIAPRLEGCSIDSSTLRLTLTWPIPSGENKAGDRGHADREERMPDGVAVADAADMMAPPGGAERSEEQCGRRYSPFPGQVNVCSEPKGHETPCVGPMVY